MDTKLDLCDNDNEFKEQGVRWLFMATLGRLKEEKNKLMALNLYFKSSLQNQRMFKTA